MNDPRSPASTGFAPLGHLDEHGRQCTRHVATPNALLGQAALGSRVASLHHDLAARLQRLMMSLDEVSDRAVAEDARRVVDQAYAALKDVRDLIEENRALARAPLAQTIALPALLARAAQRAGVKLRGELPSYEVAVAAPSMTHAFALLFDVAAGGAIQNRVLDVSIKDGEQVTIGFDGNADPSAPPAPGVHEHVAIASFLVAREGQLNCTRRGFVIKLPKPR